MNNRPIIEAISPAELIKREMEARGWTQDDLAGVLGRSATDISNLVTGKRGVNPEVAQQLGDAFSTGAQFWITLEGLYQVSRLKADDAVTRRAKLYESYPVKEILKRGWIEASNNLDVLEKRFTDFFAPQFGHAAKKSTPYSETTSAQWAWMIRVRHLAQSYSVNKFSEKSFNQCLENLKLILLNPEEIRKVPAILAEAGIRLVIVEHLPQTRIDGVCLWLDGTSPVIGLSLRLDRIDNFWYVLMHEMGHVKNKDGIVDPILDSNLVGDEAQAFHEKDEIEKKADLFSIEFCVKQTELNNFIARVRPFYAWLKIKAFAARIHVHPGIVVGQLHHRGEINWNHSREFLVKVRHILTATAITDGWKKYQQ